MASNYVSIGVDANSANAEISIGEVLDNVGVLYPVNSMAVERFDPMTVTEDYINQSFANHGYDISVTITDMFLDEPSDNPDSRMLYFVNNHTDKSYHFMMRGTSTKTGFLPSMIDSSDGFKSNNSSFVHGLYGFTDDWQTVNYHDDIYGCLRPNKTITCIPTSLSIDNTTDLPDGIYHLKVQINEIEPRVITIDKNDNWLVSSGRTKVTPAIMFGLMLAEVYIPQFYWINRPKFNSWFWDTEESKPEMTYSGMSGNTQNKFTMVPLISEGSADLYPYLAKHGESSLSILSCGIYQDMPQ